MHTLKDEYEKNAKRLGITPKEMKKAYHKYISHSPVDILVNKAHQYLDDVGESQDYKKAFYHF